MLRLVRHHPDGEAVDRGEGGHQIGRPTRTQLDDRAVVGHRLQHGTHVVAAGGRGGEHVCESGCGAVGGIRRREAFGDLVHVRGKQAQQFPDSRVGRIDVRDDERGHPATGRVHRRAAQILCGHRHAGELLHHRRTAYEGETVGNHDRHVGDAEQQGGARQHGTRHAQDDRDDPGGRNQRTGGDAPAVNGGDPPGHVGARCRHEADDRQPLLEGQLDGGPDRRAGVLGDRSVGLVGPEPHDDGRPAADLGDRGRDERAGAGAGAQIDR